MELHSSKATKKSFTIVEQANTQVWGFRDLYRELDEKVRLASNVIQLTKFFVFPLCLPL
jgi:hypothetical protein